MEQTILQENLATANAPKYSGYDSDLTDLEDLNPAPVPAKKPNAPQLSKKTPKKPKAPAKRKTGLKTSAFRSHEVPKHLLPQTPAHHFDSVYRRRSQVAHHLHREFNAPSATQIRVDFDLAVATGR
ncbi:uncharacterized protein MELLADRAFT_64638 [Melampsora larici-populina 98AG31]|uniref:Uncharacterized protein n=1 Tax=Melampsora larici-populina (strain 98AG31 / pathotype 3-4-7) TaxID=747676 RepID=F4RS79_MELLP|nr:uncharacterized protein MELLADRAFT_64638 [Melampsora larici-populina 98AG31]EGG04809.1 hypothetical protein MELLADRAFT_64638 [Melampsora larici-populina 98AG31]